MNLGLPYGFSHMLKRDDLVNLLKHYRRASSFENNLIIPIVVADCLGNDHLWQDLGLWSRAQLSAMAALQFSRTGRQKRQGHEMEKIPV